MDNQMGKKGSKYDIKIIIILINHHRGKKLKEKKELQKIIQNTGIVKQNNIILKSGIKSNYYFDLKKVLMNKKSKMLLGKIIANIIKNNKIDAVGGLECGSLPIIDSIIEHTNIEYGFYIRKKVKEYGIEKQIEGIFFPSDEVLIVDDIIITGESILNACNIVKHNFGIIKKIIVVIEREIIGKHKLQNEGYDYIAIFTKKDFKVD